MEGVERTSTHLGRGWTPFLSATVGHWNSPTAKSHISEASSSHGWVTTGIWKTSRL